MSAAAAAASTLVGSQRAKWQKHGPHEAKVIDRTPRNVQRHVGGGGVDARRFAKGQMAETRTP
jgi:hypothetical protein